MFEFHLTIREVPPPEILEAMGASIGLNDCRFVIVDF
jgi:hypothetical protein